MGADQSVDAGPGPSYEPPELPEFLQGSPTGYRVLAIQENSPACREGIVPFFDFIVEANGAGLQQEDGTFVQTIRAFENKPLTITLFNIKCKQLRQLSFVPRRGWGGDGLLGLTIKFDSFKDADDKVIHILDVVQGSPAAEAGLQPHTDYLLGTPYTAFADVDELFDLVSEVAAENEFSKPRGIDVFVYSTATDTVRRIVLTPRSGWGGSGVLGCGIGFGYLHRLPRSVLDSTGVARVEDLIAVQPRSASTPPTTTTQIQKATETQNTLNEPEGTKVFVDPSMQTTSTHKNEKVPAGDTQATQTYSAPLTSTVDSSGEAKAMTQDENDLETTFAKDQPVSTHQMLHSAPIEDDHDDNDNNEAESEDEIDQHEDDNEDAEEEYNDENDDDEDDEDDNDDAHDHDHDYDHDDNDNDNDEDDDDDADEDDEDDDEDEEDEDEEEEDDDDDEDDNEDDDEDGEDDDVDNDDDVDEPEHVADLLAGQWVSTPSGPGILLGRRSNGTFVVSLDWKLANGASCFAFLQRTSLHPIANPNAPKTSSPEHNGPQEDQHKVIDVNLGRPHPSS
mmetsp:Transcript_1567/g.3664  ORF Transcript_1567/g.3664 Transcript_1567/m.3664 type:complete len:563 (-) Transcript_1567:232-1920(-)